MTALAQLGNRVASRRAPEGPARELLELHIIDTVGAWIAGAATTEGAALLRLRAAMRDSAGDLRGLDLAIRCALARLSEIDDIHLASMTTPGAIVIPAALTLAMPETAADDVLAAMLAGYDAMVRLGRAIDGPTLLYRGIWPTYFTAPVGVAAVAARLGKLDEQQTAHALALALTFAAPGVGHHNAASTARWLAVGNAARNGLAAAQAVQQGFTSDLTLVEGGFLANVYSAKPDIGAFSGGEVLQEISFKPWCAARQTMAATQALKEIIESGVAPDSIDEIAVSVLAPHRKMIDHGVVAGDRASHLTSLPYCMAVAAVDPALAFDVQQSPAEPPPPMRAFMARIRIEADDGLLAGYPREWPARVRVAAGAAVHERQVAHVPGDPARAYDSAQVRQKFLRFVTPVLGERAAAAILARCADALSSNQLMLLAGDIDASCGQSVRRP
jgi:2-methylcitrate dehydratase PrpD